MSDYEIDTMIAPSQGDSSDDAYLPIGATHTERARALYADDPFVTPAQFGRIMEEADELDRADEANAELLDAWDRRGAGFEDAEL